MMALMTTFDALPPVCALGESPRWDDEAQCLYWCDIAQGMLHRLEWPTRRHAQWRFEAEVACCALTCRREGEPAGLVLARRDGLFHFKPDTSDCTRLAAPPYDPAQERFNDGCCDAAGRFWVGTLFEPRTAPRAGVYVLSAGTLGARALDGYTVSNGLAFSPDGRTLYSADTTAHVIYAHDYDPDRAQAGPRREFARFAPKRADGSLAGYGGRPDGACVDAQGCYWVAMYEGARVLRLSPAGQVLQELTLPVQCPTMTCLGGPDLRTLFITTSRHRRPEEELASQPLAGRVLHLRVDIPGLPVARYRP